MAGFSKVLHEDAVVSSHLAVMGSVLAIVDLDFFHVVAVVDIASADTGV